MHKQKRGGTRPECNIDAAYLGPLLFPFFLSAAFSLLATIISDALWHVRVCVLLYSLVFLIPFLSELRGYPPRTEGQALWISIKNTLSSKHVVCRLPACHSPNNYISTAISAIRRMPSQLLFPPINPLACTKTPPCTPATSSSFSSRSPRHASGNAFREVKEFGDSGTA